MIMLKTKIAAFDEAKQQQLTKDVLKTMDVATYKLKASGLESNCLNTGQTAPNFTLPDNTGELFTLSQATEQQTIVISFYRGGWCPYCNMELEALQTMLPKIEATGAKLIVISPELPEKATETKQRNGIEFTILHDEGNKLAKRFGLVFSLDKSLRPIYHDFDLDIPNYNGDTSYSLPIPATYIISKGNKIMADFIDADYTKRMEPSQIVADLNQMIGN